MSKSGKQTDKFTKDFQRSEGKNPTLSYEETGTGIRATLTAGGNEYISQSCSSKDEARGEVVKMADSSLGSVINT